MTRRLAVMLALVATAAPAFADDKPTPQQIREATGHFEAGKKLIQRQQFQDAITELNTAYELDPRSDHLYNLGVAYQLAGDDAAAIQYYRLFLDEEATGKAVENATRYLVKLEAKASEQRAQRVKDETDARTKIAAASAVDDQQLAELTRQADAAEQQAAAIERDLVKLAADIDGVNADAARSRARLATLRELQRRWELDARDTHRGTGRGRRVAGMTVVALGAAALGFGLTDYSSRGANPTTDPLLPTLAGGGAVALGLGLYISGEVAATSHEEPRVLSGVHVMPSVAPHAAAIALSASF